MSITPDYLEQTLSLIEPDEMRDYLRTHSDLMNRKKCAEVVACVPALLQEKIRVLELIAMQTESNSEWDYDESRDTGKANLIFVTTTGIVISSNAAYPLNASESICVTLSGMDMVFKEEQSSKVLQSIFVMP